MSENTILLLEDRHVKWFAEQFDAKFDFKEIIKNKIIGAVVEAVDDQGAKITLNFTNIRVSVYVPDEYKDELHAALDDVMDGDNDYTDSINNAVDVIEQLKSKLELPAVIDALTTSLLEIAKAGLFAYLEREKED